MKKIIAMLLALVMVLAWLPAHPRLSLHSPKRPPRPRPKRLRPPLKRLPPLRPRRKSPPRPKRPVLSTT